MSQTGNLTSGFIDLATYDELEKYMYGGALATAYFVRETRKSTWFTQVPVVLNRSSGTPAFGSDCSFNISRAGDYLLYTFLRLHVSAVSVATATLNNGQSLVWTPNFMHNLIRECSITFNDLVAARFDNFHLDFWAAFTVPASKENGYNNMIGNFPAFTGTNVGSGAVGALAGAAANNRTGHILNLPLPFFFSRDSGVALPTAALPYNEMRVNFQFRDWTELLSLFTVEGAGSNSAGRGATATDVTTPPTISNCQLWANYAIVSNDERKRMACAPRDILIEQAQTASVQTVTSLNLSSFDIRFSHAVKVLFNGCQNNTVPTFMSNYTTITPVLLVGGAAPGGGLNVAVAQTTGIFGDPFGSISLIYENTNRLTSMGVDYFSLVQPWYHAESIVERCCWQPTGYHMYSYSLDFLCLDPMGSTNYGKLTNVTFSPNSSVAFGRVRGFATNTLPPAAPAGLAGAGAAVGGGCGGQGNAIVGNGVVNYQQQFRNWVTCVNNNVIRISGGALGFPVL
jgi:hypothetical protein